MTRQIESYWRPQILRHLTDDASELFAIHDVYFSDFGQTWGETIDALSPKFTSVEALKQFLQDFLSSEIESIRCGDKNYEYFREDIELWLKHCDDPVLDYEEK
jgi:exonuclease III